MRPLIGLTTYEGKYSNFNTKHFTPRSYSEAVLKAGGLPVLIPLSIMQYEDDRDALRELYQRLDGVLIPGGGDIHPEYYGQYITPMDNLIERKRDRVELNLARWAFEDDRPLLGICRGHQLINVALGGSLIHDLPSDRPSNIHHDQPDNLSPATLIHQVTIHHDSHLASILNTTELKVNSLHHQAVDELAPPLRISAVSEDGIVEAVEAPQARFFLGVQWHPEWMVQQTPIQNLFRAFVAACEEYARQKTI